MGPARQHVVDHGCCFHCEPATRPCRHSYTVTTKLSICSRHTGQLRWSRSFCMMVRRQRLHRQRWPQGARMVDLGREMHTEQACSSGTSAGNGGQGGGAA